MKPLKQTISLSLDPDVIEKLKVLAEEEDRSLSQYINIILRQWLREGHRSLFAEEKRN